MFSFDKSIKKLTISKIPVAPVRTTYEDSDMYKSYMEYVTHGLKDDIVNVLVPELSKVLENAGESGIWAKSCEVIFDNNAEYHHYEYNSARISLDGYGLGEGTESFVVFKLPMMDRFGLLTREGHQYAMISELVQDDDITYKDNELKIITKAGCYINLKNTSSKFQPKVKFRGKMYKATDVMFTLAAKEGIDGISLFKKLSSFNLAGLYKNEADMLIDATYCDKAGVVQYVDTLYKDIYNLDSVRGNINEVVSLDRALGYTLFQDVTLLDGTCLPYGTEITENVLRTIKRNKVNEVYVQYIPNMVGHFIGTDTHIPYLRRGTRILPCIGRYLPEQKGLYIDRDLDLRENPIVIPEGELVTEGLLEMLAFNGHESVVLKEKEETDIVKVIPFQMSIISNRHFTKRDLGIADSLEWVYVDEEGNVEEAKSYLTAYDMLSLIALYDRLECGFDLSAIADRDLGLRKKVNQANELFHKAFVSLVPEYVKMIKNKFLSTYTQNRSDFLKADTLEHLFFSFSDKWWSKLYTDMRVIQIIDKNNPLSFYSSFAKINTIIADKNAVKRGQHSISMGHYGRLCPYETPVGGTMGIVSNRALGCKIINQHMYTGYYELLHVGDKIFLSREPKYLSVKEEEEYCIADITSLNVNWDTREVLTTGRVKARVPDKTSLEKMTFASVDISCINAVNIDPQQTDSLTASSVPMQGANDATRVIFGLSMAKQAKGLLSGDIPMVSTSAFYEAPRKSDYFMLMAEGNGVVVEAASGFIVIAYDNGEVKNYTFSPQEFSGQGIIIRNVACKEGQTVKAGDILMSSNYVKDGVMCTGKNMLTAYIPYGYNYEDGDALSIRSKMDLISFGSNSQKDEIPRSLGLTGAHSFNYFSYMLKDRLLYKLRYNVSNAEENRHIYSESLKGFCVSANYEYDKFGNRAQAIKLNAVSIDPLNDGDKIANRHGNKGVVPKLLDNTDMPLFMNGEIIDAVYNPPGVPSRMNLAQLLECKLGLACHILRLRECQSDSFNGASEKDINLLMEYTYDICHEDNIQSVIENPYYKELPKELHEHVLENIDLIKIWEGCFERDGRAWLINPKTGNYYENPVVVGINYIYKLIHESAKKEHARAGLCTEHYIPKSDTPPKGSKNHGGQRLGYMELDAYMAYGANALMVECLNGRGDNAIARNNLTVKYLHKGKKFMLNMKHAIRRSTEFFVVMLEALGIHTDFEGELPNKTEIECLNRRAYKASTLKIEKKTIETEDANDKTLDSVTASLESLI